jgi:hypothetical protein
LIRKFLRRHVVLLLISIAVMGTGCIVQADPVEGTYVSVEPPVYVAKALGEVFTINVNISNVQNLRVFEFKLGYNTTLLDAVGVAQGTFFPPPPKASVEKLGINKTMGFVSVRISLSGSERAMNGSGTLATITFNVTFAPTPPEKAYCALYLNDSLLYDDSMTAIIHDSADGLYFFRSIQVDPPGTGRLLDLYTQKGGIGQGVSDGTFKLGETVELNANLTYNDYPVQGKLMSFVALDPKNITIRVQVGITDAEGSVTIDFKVPYISDSLGTWTVVAAAEVADRVVWDFLTFEVIYAVPPHGPKAAFTEIPERPYVNEIVIFNASNSLPGWNGTGIVPIAEYRWDFGDGNKTTTSTPIIYHAYGQAGIYYVTLTVYAPGATPETDTAPTQTKLVYLIPVGGYSVPIGSTTIAQPLAPYSILAAIQAIAFAIVRRKTRKTK